jgi:protein-tyrosine-phosphatase
MAAEYLRHGAARIGVIDLEVESGGLLGIHGEPASPEAIEVLFQEGVDLHRHRSRGIERQDLQGADLVVAMTRAHLQEIERRFPGAARRALLLRAFESGPVAGAHPGDLEDPIGGTLQTYRECFGTIRICVDHLLDSVGQAR